MLKIRKSHPTFQKIQLGSLVALVGACIFAIPFVSAKPNQLSDYNRERFAQNDIVFYDPGGEGGNTLPGDNGCTPSADGSISASGDDIYSMIWTSLTSFLTNEQAAGIMGNMYPESKYNPAAHETNKKSFWNYSWFDLTVYKNPETGARISYGIGLIQWSGGRRKNFYNYMKENYSDLIHYIDERDTYGFDDGDGAGERFLNKVKEKTGSIDDVRALVAAEASYIKHELNTYDDYKFYLSATGTPEELADQFHKKVEIGGTTDQLRKDKARYWYDYFAGSSGSGGSNSSDTEDCSTPPVTSGEGGARIAETAAKFSWPVQKGQGDDSHVGQCKNGSTWVDWVDGDSTTNQANCGSTARDSYKNARNAAGITNILASCDTFVATVLYSLGINYGGSLPSRGAGTMTNFLKNNTNGEWVEVENTGKVEDLQPGDILGVTSHISIYIGEYGGSYGSNAAGSRPDWVGRITKYTKNGSKDGKWVKTDEKGNIEVYTILRYVGNSSGGENPSSGDDENPPESGDDENPPSGGEDENPPSGGEDENPPSSSGDCSSGCGLQSASTLDRQCAEEPSCTYYGVVWKSTVDKTIDKSGCSLIALTNASKALGKSVDVKAVANWSKNVVSTTGWDAGQSVSQVASHLGLTLSNYLWEKEDTAFSIKLAKIKETLASGKVVIAAGKRPSTITSCDNTSGNCTFSKYGHFVAIVGITSDGKLVVGNPSGGSKSKGSQWIYPAENVLKYSNKAKAVSL